MNQEERPGDLQRRFPEHHHRQDKHVSEVETLAGDENGIFAQRMIGAFQIIVGREEKALEVPEEHIVERKHCIKEQRIDVLEAVPRRAGFMGGKAKDAASRKRIIFAVEIDAGVMAPMMEDTPHESRAPWHRFQHIYALFFYAMFSLDYVFFRDYESFFFPSHDYLKRANHPLREYAILIAGKAFYLTYMLVLPVMVLGKSPLLVAGAFLMVHLFVGLAVTLVFQTTHTVDSTYFPTDRGEFHNAGYHIFSRTA